MLSVKVHLFAITSKYSRQHFFGEEKKAAKKFVIKKNDVTLSANWCNTPRSAVCCLKGNRVRIPNSPAAVFRITALPSTKSLRITILGKAIGNGDKSEDLPFIIFNGLRGIGFEEQKIMSGRISFFCLPHSN